MAQIKFHTFTSSNANEDIEVGFEPKIVKVTNFTNWASSGGTQLRSASWFDGMTDGYANVVNGSGTGLATVTAPVTSAGISYISTSSVGTAVSAFTNANPGVS